ncbi:MAG TPA: hypothetical protein EYO97_03560, partial [Gemmatimonadetes bacterium]|nr:hypothetical protein [Gemmatimonadota bacterium]
MTWSDWSWMLPEAFSTFSDDVDVMAEVGQYATDHQLVHGVVFGDEDTQQPLRVGQLGHVDLL